MYDICVNTSSNSIYIIYGIQCGYESHNSHSVHIFWDIFFVRTPSKVLRDRRDRRGVRAAYEEKKDLFFPVALLTTTQKI